MKGQGWGMSQYEKIKTIYEKLGDQVSKEIFMKRLLFSLSGDYKYILEMVQTEMERFGRKDIMVRLLDWIDENKRPVVIFGAGFAGTQIAGVLQTMNKPIACFIDNDQNLYKKELLGLHICSPEMLAEEKECGVIIGSNYYVSEMEEQLLCIGVDAERIFIPSKPWWLGTEEQYFEQDIMKPHLHESFIDGGALDGEDSIRFMRWCRGNYDAVYMFEPDKNNHRKLKLLSEADGRAAVYEEGLWNDTGEVRFMSGNKEKCTVTEAGDTLIRVTSIDKKLQGTPVSLIKMDIEGSEMRALEGSQETIRRFAPRLAVCVYHKPEDIVDIPLKILELYPEYRLYLRHYSYMHTETVLYAI